MSLSIVPITPPVKEDVVWRLESLLERARKGEIVEIAYVAKSSSGYHVTDFTGCDNVAERLGEITILQAHILRQMKES